MSDPVKVIPLGGLGQIGNNMTVFEQGEGCILIDAGLSFPRDEMPGVDLVLPDFTYLREGDPLDAIVITHAHEDHVGALPYVLREVGAKQVWGTRLTLGLLKSKLDEHGLLQAAEFVEIDPEGDRVPCGPFEVEFARVTHSVPDAVAVALHTSEGTIVHTGDFKLDHTPIDGRPSDLAKLARLGTAGVDLLLSDSTNAERPGMTASEQEVAAALKRIIRETPGRVIVTSFASHIHRLQEVIDASEACGRRVCVVGRSMVKNLNIARNLGYAEVAEGTLVRPQEIDNLPDDRITVLCTGSQGEPMSALTRMAFNDHHQISIRRGDTVIMSAKPVPGNELAVHDTMNALSRSGARVLHQENAPVHVSGHGAQEELKTMLSLIKPRSFMPIHGEHRMLSAHAALAEGMGVESERIFVCEAGDVLSLEGGNVTRDGQVEAGLVFVDGLGIGDPKDAVLRDRRQLSTDGTLIIVAQLHAGAGYRPEVIARGFAPEEADAADALIDDVRELAATILSRLAGDGVREHKLVQTHLHDELAELVWNRARKRPRVLPVVVDV